MRSPSVDETVVINGSFSPSMDVRDRGLAYGHGVFETMKLAAGELPLWPHHQRRLVHGLEVLGIPHDPSRVRSSLGRLLTACPAEGAVKLTVTAGVAARGYTVQAPLSPTVMAQWSPAPPVSAAVRLQVSDYRLPLNPVLAGIKHLNRLDQVLAAAASDGEALPLLLDQQERVVESLSHNLFLFEGGQWQTPELGSCGVAGVMRRVLLEEVFPRLASQVSVSNIGLEVVTSAQEVFICNSVTGVTPVTALAPHCDYPAQRRTDAVKATLAELYPCFSV